MPGTVHVQLSRFGNTTAQKPVLPRTALANVRAACSRLCFHVCASRLLDGAFRLLASVSSWAFRLLASVSSWNHRPSMVSPSFSWVQGGGMVNASATPATARFGGMKLAALWPLMNQLALGRVRPNPSLEARPNIKTPGPRSGASYYPHRGPGVLLSVPPQLER